MKKLVSWAQSLLAIALLLSSLTFILPLSFYELDLIQSFAVHALVGYGGLMLLFALFRAWRLLAAAGGAAVVLMWALHTYIIQPTPSFADKGHPFTVAHFNVLYNNHQYHNVIHQALASRADLLSFQEVSPHWVEHLAEGLCDVYPYYHIVTDPVVYTQGIAVFSRYPLSDVQTHYWSGVPNITGNIEVTDSANYPMLSGEEIRTPDTTVHFVASHTLSPRSESRYRRRNHQIRQIAQHLKSVEGPVLAIGDYNAVPWNPYIVAMKQEARLYDSRRTFTSTYPSRLRAGGLPIDYVFHSKDFTCVDFHAVSARGSDHRGVVGTYLLRSPLL